MPTVTVSPVAKASIDDLAIARWISARLNEARNKFIIEMSRNEGGGKIHRRRTVWHVASGPGQYPLTDSGRLVGSVHYGMESKRKGFIYSNLHYAAFLETGTQFMAPRKMFADAFSEILEARPGTDELAQAVKLGYGTFE